MILLQSNTMILALSRVLRNRKLDQCEVDHLFQVSKVTSYHEIFCHCTRVEILQTNSNNFLYVVA